MERKRGGLHLDWFVSSLVVICLYFAYNIIQQQSHLNAIERGCGEVQMNLEAARQKNQELRAEKSGLESYEYIEKWRVRNWA